MITLITGGPGTGKTAWTLNQLLTLKENEPQKLLFIHGIRNLRGIQHTQIYCKSQLCDICRAQDSKLDESSLYVETWQEWKQPDSIIIIDEVQRIWRPRGGTGTPPPDISLLETHRHYGVDFWLISQGPHLFDNFIRLLVGRHVHLVSKWSGRYEYEWPECKQNVQSRADAVERPYKLPKRVYKLYDSAEVHTKQNKRAPLALYGLIVAVIFFLIALYFVYNRVQSRVNAAEEETGVVAGPSQASPSKTPKAMERSEQPKQIPMETAHEIQEAYTPKIPSLPWSAPIYQEQAKPVTFPKMIGCIKIDEPERKACKCYTQQASVIDMPPAICEQYVKARSFNQFKPDKIEQNQNNQYIAYNYETKPETKPIPSTRQNPKK